MDHPSVLETESESEKCIGIAANLLCDGNFASCRKFALAARDHDPENLLPARILAVADVMLAKNSPDPNDVLQLTRPDSRDRRLVRTQFEKLTALLSPEENCFPFSDEALGLVNQAWAALFDPVEETRFGNGPKNWPGSPKRSEENLAGETFWTVCPYCYGMFMYKKVYLECCLRCQVCRKAFSGLEIRPPAPEILVEGKDEYYFTYGYFPMEYSEDPKKGSEDPKKGTEDPNKKSTSVVEISDDEEEKEEEVVEKNVGGGKAPVKRKKAPARRMKGMKSKTVAKKRMGNGMEKELDLNDECGNEDDEIGDLVFFEGEDDVLVDFF